MTKKNDKKMTKKTWVIQRVEIRNQRTVLIHYSIQPIT